MRDLRSAAASLVALLFAFAAPLSSESQTPASPSEEAAAELFATELGDSDVSLTISGSWKGTVSSTWGLALTPLGTRASGGDGGPLLFLQETDLTLALWIRERWFVEASFLDDYDLNTYRAGYRGLEGETVRYVGIGNTGLDFPSFPYLDLGGDTPNSLGAYGRFGSGDLGIHALARYDGAVLSEKVFQGGRERSSAELSAAASRRGRSFVLPDAGLDGQAEVYLEDAAGSLSGSDGRKWRRAQAGEFAASAALGLLELTAAPAGRLAVAYRKGGDSSPWNSSLGDYGTAAVPGGGFLGDAQAAFATAGRLDEDLRDYPQPGNAAGPAPATVTIAGSPALVLYEAGTFSPFEVRSRYEAPFSSVQSASLVRSSTGDRISGYLIEAESAFGAAAESGSRGFYEVMVLGRGTDRRSAEARWPLLALAPELYLPGKAPSSQDLSLRFSSYGAPGAYDIGTDAVPGSVQAYRDGFPDPSASYDPASGLVTFSGPVAAEEKIRIVFLRRSEDGRFGSLSAGIGAVYENSSPLSGALALGLRWNLSSESFASDGASHPGMVALGGKIGWNEEKLALQAGFGLAYEQTDTTNLYRAAGMEGAELDLDWDLARAFPSEEPRSLWGATDLPFDPTAASRAPLVYRDYRSTDLLGTTTVKPIEWDGADRVSGREGPYPVSDSGIKTQAAVAEFVLDADRPWSGYQVRLGENAAALETAKEILLPLRFYDASVAAGTSLQVWVQFGRLSDEGAGGAETGSPAVSRKIFDSALHGPPPSSWSIRKISLDEADRRLLAQARYLRVVVLRAAGVGETGRIEARLLAVPPIAVGSTFRAVSVGAGGIPAAAADASGSGVAAAERPDPALRAAYPALIDRLHSGGALQRVLELTWKGLASGVGPGVDGRTARLPLENYRVLSFFIKGPRADLPEKAADLAAGTLRFAVARGPESLAPERRSREVALEAAIPLSALEPGRWSKVELRYGAGESSVSVEGREISGAELVFRRGALPEAGSGSPGRASYIALFLEPASGSLPDGSFSADEIILEENVPYYRGNFGAALRAGRSGTVLELGGVKILSDAETELAMESVLRGDPAYPDEGLDTAVLGRASASAQVLGSAVRGNLRISAADQVRSWSGGHGIETPLGPLTLTEAFSVDPADERLRHQIGADLRSPLAATLAAELNRDGETLSRAWEGSLRYGDKRMLQAEGKAQWTEAMEEHPVLPPAYGGAWTWSWPPLIPDAGENARTRTAEAKLRGGLEEAPLGLLLSAEGKSSFNGPRATLGSEARGAIEVPVQIGALKGRVTNTRAVRRASGNPGTSIGKDGERLIETVADSGPLFLRVPAYPLFDGELRQLFLETLAAESGSGTPEGAAFVETLDLQTDLPPRSGPSAIFVPSSLRGRAERKVEKTYDTDTDSTALSAGLDFTALNLFGAFGTRPLFSFYRDDELFHSLEALAVYSDAAEAQWSLKARQALGFFGFQGAQLELNNTYVLSGTGWSEAAALAWTVPTKKSLLSALYDRAMDALRNRRNWPALWALSELEARRFRRETLELTLDYSGDGAVAFLVGHESIVRIDGRLGLSAFGSLSVQWSAASETTTVLAAAGTTLHLTY